MSRRVSLIYRLIFLFQYINYSTAVEYEFVLEERNFLTECEDMPGALNIAGMLDLTNLNISIVEDGIEFSGNVTSVWPGLDPSDRVQMAGSVQYFDRGTWVPTILNMLVPDFCKVMYDDKQLWYKPWISHIINRKDIAENCLKVPGTVFVFETFMANFRFGSGIILQSGRYSIRALFSAYDKLNTKRPAEVCYEIKGQFHKV